jgi:hypothetical protein
MVNKCEQSKKTGLAKKEIKAEMQKIEGQSNWIALFSYK